MFEEGLLSFLIQFVVAQRSSSPLFQLSATNLRWEILLALPLSQHVVYHQIQSYRDVLSTIRQFLDGYTKLANHPAEMYR